MGRLLASQGDAEKKNTRYGNTKIIIKIEENPETHTRRNFEETF